MSEEYLTPNEQKVLLESWMSNGISFTTYFNNLQKAGIIEDERSIEDERAEIETDREKKIEDQLELEEEKADIENSSSDDVDMETDLPTPEGITKNISREGSDYDTE